MISATDATGLNSEGIFTRRREGKPEARAPARHRPSTTFALAALRARPSRLRDDARRPEDVWEQTAVCVWADNAKDTVAGNRALRTVDLMMCTRRRLAPVLRLYVSQ